MSASLDVSKNDQQLSLGRRAPDYYISLSFYLWFSKLVSILQSSCFGKLVAFNYERLVRAQLELKKWRFCPYEPVVCLRAHAYVFVVHTPHIHISQTGDWSFSVYLTHLNHLSFFFSFFARKLPIGFKKKHSLYLWIGWLDSTLGCLGQRIRHNCAALVRGGGWQRGQGRGNRKRLPRMHARRISVPLFQLWTFSKRCVEELPHGCTTSALRWCAPVRILLRVCIEKCTFIVVISKCS